MKNWPEQFFPKYCFGEFYAMTIQSAMDLFATFARIVDETYVWIEDVYITGVLSRTAKIDLIDLSSVLPIGGPNSNFLAAGLRENYDLKTQKRIWEKTFS